MKTKETSNKVTCNQCGKQKTGSIEGICEHCGKFGNVKSTRELTGREIEEIYNKEVLEPKRQEEWQESQVNRRYSKPNQKQFKEGNDDLFRAYINKFSQEYKARMLQILIDDLGVKALVDKSCGSLAHKQEITDSENEKRLCVSCEEEKEVFELCLSCAVKLGHENPPQHDAKLPVVCSASRQVMYMHSLAFTTCDCGEPLTMAQTIYADPTYKGECKCGKVMKLRNGKLWQSLS